MKESTKKAKELIGMFFRITPQPYSTEEIEFNDKKLKFQEWDKEWTMSFAKKSAIICVDEIILTLNKDIRDLDVVGNVLLDLIAFWQEVRQEIINYK